MKIYIDGHCDTLENCFDKNIKLSNESNLFNTTKAKEIAPVIQLAATFVHTKFENGWDRANEIIDNYLQDKGGTVLIKNKKDLEKVITNNEIGIVLTIENGKAIENELNNIQTLYEKGIRVMSVTWNDDNLLGCGATTPNDTGLTYLGKKYVKALEEKNILIDISHTSEKTFWDVVKNTNKTIVATHSNCYNVCNHPRNLKDNQIKEIAKRSGIVGICLSSPFLNSTGIANVKDIVKHISYIIDLVGEDYVGLGTDFDGVSENHQLTDIKGIKDIWILEKELKEYGYSTETINKIMGENWLKIIEKIVE